MGTFVEKFMDWYPGGRYAVASAASLPAAVDYAGEDRISALPDELLGCIVSRLPVKDAARTAAIASRWRHLWRSTPLVLRDAGLLRSAVARVLADHLGPFRVVDISRCRFASHDCELVEWLRLLATKGVQDLLLVDDTADITADNVRLPTDILRCASLQRLFLGFFTFPDTAGLSRRADVLPHLQELSLFRTSISDRDLDHLLACSSVLEKLLFVLHGMPRRLVHLRSESLRCVVLWILDAEGVDVVDAPLLERLFLLEGPGSGDMMIKIACAPNLRALGYLEPRFHRLQIGDNVIKPDTMPSSSTVAPGVKILAFKVNFGVLKEVTMLVAFLRCFPNIETLHIECLPEPTGRNHAMFWQEVSTIECIKSHVKKMVIHEYRGGPNELEFLKFISRTAQELQTLDVLLNRPSLTSVAKETWIRNNLVDLSLEAWSCDCTIKVLGLEHQNDWSIQKASDLTSEDPFY